MKYSITFARNSDIDNIQHETVNAPDEQVARNMFTVCDCYIYDCALVISDPVDAALLQAAHAAGFPNAVIVEPFTVDEAVAVQYGQSELKPDWMIQAEAEHADWLDENKTREDARL